jgi:exosortase
METYTQIDPLRPTSGAPTGTSPTFGAGHPALELALLALPIGYLWFRLINNLRLEWATNPEYAFGWLVPLLCLGLALRKRPGLPKGGNWNPEAGIRKSTVMLFALSAILYLPTRLIEAAIPEWRPIQWMLGAEAIGITLCAIYIGKGRTWLRQLAFPIAFVAAAIPWPTLIETPIIQGLTRVSTVIVVEVLGWAGVPAMPHGNVIEIATGMVGIEEACSGIRSFQTSIVISLFFGEFYALSRPRRWLLIPVGIALSLALNVGRMFLLTFIAARNGVSAIEKYHDPAGITIAIACTLVLWGLAWLLWKRASAADSGQKLNSSSLRPRPSALLRRPLFNLKPLAPGLSGLLLALLAWLVTVETAVHLWYRHLEFHIRPGPAWSLNFPRDNATLKELPVSADARYLLRFDDGRQAGWTESDGTQWQAYYFNWLPGRVAGYLAKRHTPEICLQATGLKMRAGPELTMMKVHGVDLPVRSYVFETPNGLLQVFHCRWEAGADESAYTQHESGRFNLMRAIWAGRGNQGQKVWEIIIAGMNDSGQAKAALKRQLEKLITVRAVGAPNSVAVR